MKKTPRPAWLIGIAIGLSAAAFLNTAGLARFSKDVSNAGGVIALAELALKSDVRAAAPSDSIQLSSAGGLRLGTFERASDPVDELDDLDRPTPMNGLCPADMASIDDRFCVDKYEASLVEILPNGEERAWPYFQSVDKRPDGTVPKVRAVSQPGVYPQGYISGKQAAAACKASGKRLCKPQEWKTACKGPEKKQYGYADTRAPGVCNDNGKSGLGKYFAREVATGAAYSSAKIMNDPQLNQMPGSLAETGSHEGCTNGYGVHDMVGNIHEWVDDPAGTFQGGYYLDVEKNGDGCGYRTDAHEVWYHDYSTGFRCCADVGQ